MKKTTLLKTLIMAVALCVGTSAWAVETVGAPDFSTGYLSENSSVITIADGGSIHYTFTQSHDQSNNWFCWLLYAGTTGETVSSSNAKIILRNDNWEDKAGSNTGCSNNFTWGEGDATFRSEMDGATFDMAVGYSSGTFTMKSIVTTAIGKKYYYTYSKTIDAAPSSLDVCLSVNAAYLTISTSDYYAPAGAGSFYATLDHTAAVQGDSNPAGTSLDAATHYYNNWGTSGWAGQAYIGFTYELPNAECSVTEATLKFYSNCGGKKNGRSLDVYYKDGASFNWNSLSLSNASGTKLTTVTDNMAVEQKVINATSAVNAILGSSTSGNILFQLGGAAAGGTLQGKATTEYDSPSLYIAYTNSATASYTVKYYESDGTYIKDGATYNSIPVGSIVTATSGDQATFVNGDYKYAYSFSGACVIDGSASNVLCVFCTKESKVDYTVTAKSGDETLTTLSSGSVFASDAVKVFWNKYIKVKGQWYVADEATYGTTITTATNNVAFTATDAIDYFFEFEDMTISNTYNSAEGATYSNGSAKTLGSNGANAKTASTIPAGVYTISMYGKKWDSKADNYRVSYSTDGTNWATLGDIAYGSSEEGLKSLSNAIIPAASYIKFETTLGVQTPRRYMDYITFKKTANLPATENIVVSSAGYATYVSNYNLDFSDPALKVKAYTVEVASKGVATLHAINKVPAKTPVLLIGATENVPVTTSTDAVPANHLVAGPVETLATTDGDYKNMILNNVGGKIGFYFANDQTVAANRAYLHIASTLAPDASESRMVMVFADDEATAVFDLNDNSEMINNNWYDLQGRRVDGSRLNSGIYIKNGKKVVVK